MKQPDQRLHELHYDFIAHVAQRFGIPAEVVTLRLGEWLLDPSHDNRAWQRELTTGA